MFFSQFNDDDSVKTLEIDYYGDIFLRRVLLMVLAFFPGIFVLSQMDVPFCLAIIFFAIACILPYPISPMAYHFLALPVMYYAYMSEVTIAFSIGRFRGIIVAFFCIITGVVMFFSMLSDSMFSEFGNFFVFIFFFAMIMAKATALLFVLCSISAGIGLSILIADVIRNLILHAKLRRYAVVCLIMLVLGGIPLLLLNVFFGSDAITSDSIWMSFVILLAVYIVLGILSHILSRVFKTYVISGCLPAVVPMMIMSVFSIVNHLGSQTVCDETLQRFFSRLSEYSGMGTQKDFLTTSSLNELTSKVFSRGVVSCFRILIYGTAMVITCVLLDVVAKRKKKD